MATGSKLAIMVCAAGGLPPSRPLHGGGRRRGVPGAAFSFAQEKMVWGVAGHGVLPARGTLPVLGDMGKGAAEVFPRAGTEGSRPRLPRHSFAWP